MYAVVWQQQQQQQQQEEEEEEEKEEEEGGRGTAQVLGPLQEVSVEIMQQRPPKTWIKTVFNGHASPPASSVPALPPAPQSRQVYYCPPSMPFSHL